MKFEKTFKLPEVKESGSFKTKNSELFAEAVEAEKEQKERVMDVQRRVDKLVE